MYDLTKLKKSPIPKSADQNVVVAYYRGGGLRVVHAETSLTVYDVDDQLIATRPNTSSTWDTAEVRQMVAAMLHRASRRSESLRDVVLSDDLAEFGSRYPDPLRFLLSGRG